MLGRMLGAARLKVDTFEDVEHDRGATLQALAVVIIVAIATGIGGLLGKRKRHTPRVGFRRSPRRAALGSVGVGDLDQSEAPS